MRLTHTHTHTHTYTYTYIHTHTQGTYVTNKYFNKTNTDNCVFTENWYVVYVNRGETTPSALPCTPPSFLWPPSPPPPPLSTPPYYLSLSKSPGEYTLCVCTYVCMYVCMCVYVKGGDSNKYCGDVYNCYILN